MEITVLGLIFIVIYLIWSYFSIRDIKKFFTKSDFGYVPEVYTMIWIIITGCTFMLILIDFLINNFDWSFLSTTLIKI